MNNRINELAKDLYGSGWVKTEERAKNIAYSIYMHHFCPLDAALEKAEADTAVLVEALGKIISILDIINERMPGGTYYVKYKPLAKDALMKANAALARVRGK